MHIAIATALVLLAANLFRRQSGPCVLAQPLCHTNVRTPRLTQLLHLPDSSKAALNQSSPAGSYPPGTFGVGCRAERNKSKARAPPSLPVQSTRCSPRRSYVLLSHPTKRPLPGRADHDADVAIHQVPHNTSAAFLPADSPIPLPEVFGKTPWPSRGECNQDSAPKFRNLGSRRECRLLSGSSSAFSEVPTGAGDLLAAPIGFFKPHPGTVLIDLSCSYQLYRTRNLSLANSPPPSG